MMVAVSFAVTMPVSSLTRKCSCMGPSTTCIQLSGAPLSVHRARILCSIHRTAHWQVSVRIPAVGGRVERALEKGIREAYRLMPSRTLDYLKKKPQRAMPHAVQGALLAPALSSSGDGAALVGALSEDAPDAAGARLSDGVTKGGEGLLLWLEAFIGGGGSASAMREWGRPQPERAKLCGSLATCLGGVTRQASGQVRLVMSGSS